MNDHRVTSIAELEALYGQANPPSRLKEIDHVNAEYAALIKASPFCVLASSGPGGLDCTPRGDAPGFVDCVDPKTLVLPDRRGNNRIDSLRNIVVDPRVALLFLVPGSGETLRVNGRAEISVAPSLLERYVVQQKVPRSALVVHVESVYFQCSKAIVRSDLWNATKHVGRDVLPSIGQMMTAARAIDQDAASYDAAYPERIKSTLY